MAKQPLNINRLPSNSRNKPNSPEAVPRLTGEVHVKERTPGYAEVIRDLGNSIFANTMVPFVKDIVWEFITGLLNQALHGGQNAPRGGMYYGRQGGVQRSYNQMYRSRAVEPTRPLAPRATRDAILDDIFFHKYRDAELVLGHLLVMIADYKLATVGHFYQYAGVQSNPTKERYGWYDLSNVNILSTTDGFLIDFPPPQYLG